MALSEAKSIIKDNKKYTVPLFVCSFPWNMWSTKRTKVTHFEGTGTLQKQTEWIPWQIPKGDRVLVATGLLIAVQTDTTNWRKVKNTQKELLYLPLSFVFRWSLCSLKGVTSSELSNPHWAGGFETMLQGRRVLTDLATAVSANSMAVEALPDMN